MNQVSINLSNYINNILPSQIIKGLEKSGQLVENEAKIQLTEGSNKAIDSGVLRASITHNVNQSQYSTSIGSNVEYAQYVHDGTYKMQARPFLRNAVDYHLSEIIDCFRG